MKRLIVTALAFAASAGAARAEEVIIERERPVVVEPAPRDVVIERRRPDCSTTTTRRENGAGDSETVTRRDCN